MSTSTPSATAAATIWEIDPAHSVVELAVKHMMFSTVKGLSASSVRAEIDAASIDTREAQRDGHLRSADFLDVEKYPTIAFVSTEVVPQGRDHFVVIGDLTLHGVTRGVSLETELAGKGIDPWGGQRAGFTATTTISRKDFGLTWNQGLEAGGVLVGDQVKISVEIQAKLQAG
jgi:polyisoprenoid-binding protein YceI